MRTTVILSDHLVLEAKKRAAQERSTLSEIINEGLLLRLQQPSPEGAGPRIEIPTYRGKGPLCDSSPGDLRQLEEDGDGWRVADA